MIPFFKAITSAQWIMLATLVTISSLMLLATDAHAFTFRKPMGPRGTTISHCGWVDAGPHLYTHSFRNTRIIQRKLAEMGYDLGRGGIDGKAGPKTRAAIAAFQTDHGLSADGAVGGQTATILAYITHPAANVRRCKGPYQG